MIVKWKDYDYNGACSVLQKKGLISELWEILLEITEVDHSKIQLLFHNKGWEVEKRILSETTWRWDAYKDKVVVSIEFSLIDAVHRDFFRLLMWHQDNKLDVVIYITTMSKEPKFSNVMRDIEICRQKYPHLLPFPIYLIGLEE